MNCRKEFIIHNNQREKQIQTRLTDVKVFPLYGDVGYLITAKDTRHQTFKLTLLKDDFYTKDATKIVNQMLRKGTPKVLWVQSIFDMGKNRKGKISYSNRYAKHVYGFSERQKLEIFQDQKPICPK